MMTLEVMHLNWLDGGCGSESMGCSLVYSAYSLHVLSREKEKERGGERDKEKIRPGLNRFWDKFKDSLIDMFKEEDDKEIK